MANHETITRRAALAATAAGVAAFGGSEASAQPQTRKTFVLIHGGYHGGWCWKKVTDILERSGHKVYAPSLTGLADRSHLLSKDTSLDTHIADIVNLFKWEEITNACLVPHSNGGWPCSGALEQIGDRVSSIVWLDAFMPKDGERALDTMSESTRKTMAEAMARGEACEPCGLRSQQLRVGVIARRGGRGHWHWQTTWRPLRGWFGRGHGKRRTRGSGRAARRVRRSAAAGVSSTRDRSRTPIAA